MSPDLLASRSAGAAARGSLHESNRSGNPARFPSPDPDEPPHFRIFNASEKKTNRQEPIVHVLTDWLTRKRYGTIWRDTPSSFAVFKNWETECLSFKAAPIRYDNLVTDL